MSKYRVYLLRGIPYLVLAGSGLWFISEPSWEPLIGILAGLYGVLDQQNPPPKQE